MLETYAEQNGYTNIVHYTDDGYSGGRFARPAFTEIMELDKDKEQNDGIEKFIAKVKAITDIQELTPEIVREFISRIDVYAPYRKDKQRHQNVDIYYHGVGYVFIPEPEEVEEMFQEHLRDRKENIKEKKA